MRDDVMTCDAFADTLADLLEREVDETTRASMETHALSCERCGPLLADLRKLRVDAASLPELSPSRDLWPGIAARIDAPVIAIGMRDAGSGKREAGSGKRDAGSGMRVAGRGMRRGWRWVGIAAAAAVLVAVTATTTRYLTIRGTDHVLPTTPPAPDAVASVENTPSQPTVAATAAPLPASRVALPPSPFPRPASRESARLVTNRPTADQVYVNEISRLRSIIDNRRSQLDPVTVGVIEHNLAVIDSAIAQCRSALAKDPASAFLMQSLNNALENKVELLRTAATLPPRT